MTSYKIPSKSKLVKVALFWGSNGEVGGTPSSVCESIDDYSWTDECWEVGVGSTSWRLHAELAASIALSEANLSSTWK